MTNLDDIAGDIAERTRYLVFIERAFKLAAWDYTDMLWWRVGLNGQQDDKIHPMVNCNDAFVWACADCEEITQENVDLLEQTIRECEAIVGKDRADDAFLLWVCRVRNMRPQGAMYQYLDSELWDLFDAAGPEREAGLGDPLTNEQGKERQRQAKAAAAAKKAERELDNKETP